MMKRIGILSARAIRNRPPSVAGHVVNGAGLFVRPGFDRLSPEERRRICNGVGGADGISSMAPDTILFLNVREAADAHDYDYHVGGTAADKLSADVAFYWNCERLVSRGCRLLYALRMRRVTAYYWAVRTCGRRFFRWSDAG